MFFLTPSTPSPGCFAPACRQRLAIRTVGNEAAAPVNTVFA